MKTIALALITASTVFAATDAIVPQPFSRERYEKTRDNSPFILATKEEPKVDDNKPLPFANLYVVGLGRAEGKEYVTIVRLGEEANPIRLWGSTPDEDGMSVQQVVWSDAIGKSKVKLKKGTEVGEIGFSENAVKSAVAGSPVPQPNGNRPPVPGAPTNGFNRPPNAPAQPNTAIPRPTGATPLPPGGGASIPRPPGNFTPPTNKGNNAPGGNNPSSQGRQRIRVIQNQ